MANLKLFLLGAPYLEMGGETIVIQRRKVMALLIYLAVQGEAQRRDTLASLLWPNSPTRLAHGSLRRTLSELRKVLGGDWVSSDREMIGLNPDRDLWLDVVRFQKGLAGCSTATPASLDAMNEAVRLYRGDFLAGFTLPDCLDFDEWQFFQGEGLRQTLATALERLSHLHCQQGEYEEAISHARRWLALDPLHEPAQRRLMILYAQAGQQAAALRQYQLCVETLEAELGIPPADETTALYERIRAGDPSRVPGKHEREKDSAVTDPDPRSFRSLALEQAPLAHNLPPQLTSFIGRDDDLAKILRLLCDEADCRLLTLFGPGGIGKTRLALRAAEQALSVFSNGVYFVPLVGVSEPEFLVSTIAEALDTSFSGEVDPRRQLLNHLRDKEMLLVLDNFEHLLEGVDLLSEIVLTASQAKLLVTSRTRLNLQEEWGFEVKGMRYPLSDDAEGPTPETYSAVQLFVERARRVKTDFALSAKDAPAVLQICRLVAGTPLGIELAVFWLRLMPCQEIARRIEQSLDFLTTSIHNVPERHRSLRAVFEHSWLLLSEDERAVFSQLSVFRGGFHNRAARRVAGATLPLLSALVDKSLVQHDRKGRYKIHELLRQFAAEKLQEKQGESERLRDRHCVYYSSFLQAREPHLQGQGQRETLQPIMVEIDNIRAAWHWAIERGYAETAGKFV
ncbi:MAG: BTAD domain-containing putative transcriptional regulator, partial [Anaerolineae bacterium]